MGTADQGYPFMGAVLCLMGADRFRAIKAERLAAFQVIVPLADYVVAGGTVEGDDSDPVRSGGGDQGQEGVSRVAVEAFALVQLFQKFVELVADNAASGIDIQIDLMEVGLQVRAALAHA